MTAERRHHIVTQLHVGGMSLVELVIAVALLSLISVAALQFIQMSESTMFGEQAKLTKQQQSEAISAHIYKKFASGVLTETPVERVYLDADMPEDLRRGPGVSLVALFGNSSRYDGVDPRCTLVTDANVTAGSFQIRQDCMTQGAQTITQQMNALIGKGVVLTTGLEDGVGRCSISRPIAINASTGVATVSVDDPGCLVYGQDLARGVPAGKQVLLPRYVAYDTANPATFHTSMIEPPDVATAGIGLEMPSTYRMDGGGVPNAAAFVNAQPRTKPLPLNLTRSRVCQDTANAFTFTARAPRQQVIATPTGPAVRMMTAVIPALA